MAPAPDHEPINISANKLLIFDLHSKHILSCFYQRYYQVKPSESLWSFSHIFIEDSEKFDQSLVTQAHVFDFISVLLRRRRSESLINSYQAIINIAPKEVQSTKIHKKCLTILKIWDLYINATFNQLETTINQLKFIEQTSNIGAKLKGDVSELIEHLEDSRCHNVLPRFITDDSLLIYFTKLLKRCQFTFSDLSDEYNELFLESDVGTDVDEEVSIGERQTSEQSNNVRKSPRIREKDIKQKKSKRTRENSDKSNITESTDDNMDFTNISDKAPCQSPRHAPQAILNSTNPPQFSTPLPPTRPSKRRTKNTIPLAKRTLFNPETSMIFDQTPNSSIAPSSPGSVASDVSVLSSSVLVHGRGKNPVAHCAYKERKKIRGNKKKEEKKETRSD